MQKAIILSGVLFLTMLCATSQAHRPIFSEKAATGPDTAILVAQPVVSQVIYREITEMSPQVWLVLDANEGFELFIQIGIPVITRLQDFRPAVALVGPDLPKEVLQIEIPAGMGARFFPTDSVKDPRFFHEHFTGTDSWILRSETVTLPATGRYYVVAYAPSKQAGKLWLSLGKQEAFQVADIVQFGEWKKRIRGFHEVAEQTGAATIPFLSELAGLFTAGGRQVPNRNITDPCETTNRGRVLTYSAPAGEVLSTDYEVQAAGQKVDVYSARVLDPPFAGKQWDHGGPYSFANFDMSGPVTVRIVSKQPLRNVAIRPLSSGVQSTLMDDHTMNLMLDQPRKLSVEPDGKKGPLLLFANWIETDAPRPDDEGVIYFGPGVHKPEKIFLQSDQTLYLAGGAVVKAEVLVEGNNIRIRGRGILDGSDWAWRKGPIGSLIAIRNSINVEVTGITLRGSSHWTIVPKNSRQVTIRNVKLCNSRVQNDDGINPCNSQDVLITDCFIRSDDDCVALKGLDFSSQNSNVERITVENSVLWCDRARIFLLGHESRAAFMRKVELRNLDIIHFTMTAFLLEPGEDMRLEDINIKDIRIHGEGQRELIRLRPVVNQYMHKKVPGFIRNVNFKNIVLEGRSGDYLVQIEEGDAEHGVKDVTFEDISIAGSRLQEGSDRLIIGKYTENIVFRTTAK